MTRVNFILALLIFGTVQLCACGKPADFATALEKEDSERSVTTTSADQHSIEEGTIRSNEIAAASGDVRAAESIALYFESLNDMDRSMFWLQIAAENGSPTAMQHLSAQLNSDGGVVSCHRAIYWLERIHKSSFSSEIIFGLRVDEFLAEQRRDLPECIRRDKPQAHGGQSRATSPRF